MIDVLRGLMLRCSTLFVDSVCMCVCLSSCRTFANAKINLIYIKLMYKIRNYIFRTNKYLRIACRAASASSSKYGLTSSIFNFITFPGNCFNVLFLNESSCFYQFVNYFFLCYHEQKLWKIPNIHVY